MRSATTIPPLKFSLPEPEPGTSWKIYEVRGVSYLEEVTEQINVLVSALEAIREVKDEVDAASTTSNKSSSWGSSSKQPAETGPSLSPLPPKQHPLLLYLWSKSSSDKDFRNFIASKLGGLIDERRSFLSDLETTEDYGAKRRRNDD
ncbi:hypothetical protein BGZ76_000696 [Entomortierella beljakovae]|nr:hypothetical protein BGZ76_000696 [Entomortierella beljakovae]